MAYVKKCALAQKGIVRKGGKVVTEWIDDDGKAYRYCLGIIDLADDEFFSDCKVCPYFIDGEQAEKDWELFNQKWNFEEEKKND